MTQSERKVLYIFTFYCHCPIPLHPLHFFFFFCLPSPFLSSPSFHFVFLIPSLHSHHLHFIIVPPALHPKENGKTANPAASYGIRVYQPIMPFSDLFSSQDRSLCACIPATPPPPDTFPLSPNKGGGCCIFSCKTSCNITPPPPTP